MECPTIAVVKWDGMGAMLETAGVSRVGMDKDGGVRCDDGCSNEDITLELLCEYRVTARWRQAAFGDPDWLTALWCP